MRAVVVGGGPAGSSCAIQLCKAGVQVTVIDRAEFPRHAPGETLHPGIEPLLRQLGVYGAIKSWQVLRHRGVATVRDHAEAFEAYNAEEGWEGFQLDRRRFDALLLERARALGAEVVTGVRLDAITRHRDGRLASVVSGAQAWDADVFLDATGRRGWLAQQLGIDYAVHSPRRLAYFGYVAPNGTDDAEVPRLIWCDDGWSWIARVRPEAIAWVRLVEGEHAKLPKSWQPPELRDHRALQDRGAVDVTWRIADTLASESHYLLGDAGFMLDPAASHGVLKALMSGIMAAYLIEHGSQPGRPTVQQAYRSWMTTWFDADRAALQALYDQNLSAPARPRPHA